MNVKNQLSEQRPSEEIRDKLGIQDISMVMRQMRLWWFGPLESMKTENWVTKCGRLMIHGAAGRGRPHKTWNQVVQKYFQIPQLEKALAQDRVGWRDTITKTPSYPC